MNIHDGISIKLLIIIIIIFFYENKLQAGYGLGIGGLRRQCEWEASTGSPYLESE